MRKNTLALCFALIALVGCITPGSPINGPGVDQGSPTPQEHIAAAIDLSTCTATDVLPGVEDTVTHLASTDTSVLEKVLRGIVGTVNAASRAYACATRSLATRRTQADGEVAAAAKPEDKLVAARAKACTDGRCPRPEHGAALALQRLIDAGLVTLPASGQ